jgi:hypothetical protein
LEKPGAEKKLISAKAKKAPQLAGDKTAGKNVVPRRSQEEQESG